LTWKQVEAGIRPKIYYDSQTALICLENTVNMWGGTVYPTSQVEEICDHAHAMDLKVHLDGARIFNAAAALGEKVAQMTRKVDSVMFCLSKGLGAPVGSMVCWQQSVLSRRHASTGRCWRRDAAGRGDRGGGADCAGEVTGADCMSTMKRETTGRRHRGNPRADHGPEESTVKHRDLLIARKQGRRRVEICDALHPYGIWAQDTALHRCGW